MWGPKDADEIETAARRSNLTETSTFDAKEALPATAKKNKDVAVDVAAMSTDGGDLLYGIAEDADGRPTVPQPIELAGTAERVDQIVQHGIAEPPYVEFRE